MRWRSLLAAVALVALAPPGRSAEQANADSLLRDAAAAEARFDLPRALELYLAAEKAGRADAATLQKIARQYSDLVQDTSSRGEQRRRAQLALDYSQRATALDPKNPVNVLSVAISYGKLALVSDARDKVRYSKLVRQEAERALALDPNYSWAHHVLGRWHMEVAQVGATSRAFANIFLGGLPKGSVAEAIKHFERAVELVPGELQHHIELGFAYHASGDRQRARAELERGIALPPRAKIDVDLLARAREALKTLAPPGASR